MRYHILFQNMCTVLLGAYPAQIPLGGGSRTSGIKDIDPEDQVKNWSRLIYYGCGGDLLFSSQFPKGVINRKVVLSTSHWFTLPGLVLPVTWPASDSRFVQGEVSSAHVLISQLEEFPLWLCNQLKLVDWFILQNVSDESKVLFPLLKHLSFLCVGKLQLFIPFTMNCEWLQPTAQQRVPSIQQLFGTHYATCISSLSF